MKHETQTILMTAFEPSGDALGAMAAKGLKERNPSVQLYGLGGSEMEEVGVELLANTTHEAKMGVGAISQIVRVKRLVDLVAKWIETHQVDVVVAVDSPAANWSVCKAAKKNGCNVLHLAAPQLWAWAPWRLKKMKRLSDHVMCLLPFEPNWFESRGMPATFIGHPAMVRDEIAGNEFQEGEPNIVLLPGSRKSEIVNNLPLQQTILRRIREVFPEVEAVIACRGEDVQRVQPLAKGLQIVSDDLPSVLEWSDFALTVSGTVSLHVMRHATPMVGMYKVNLLSMLAAKIVLNTPFRLLPNLIAGKEIVPEFIPCCHATSQIAQRVVQLLQDEMAMRNMSTQLQEEAAMYNAHNPSLEAADIILSFAS